MTHSFRFLLAVSLGAGALFAQESALPMPEFHGFLVQSMTYSGSNNYLGMDTSSGAFDCTEAAVNVNEQLTPKLRVGAQFHTTKFGKFGSWVPGLDWALVDYRAKPWLGIRAGRVKIRWGLYNDTQDADPGYLWSLLPEPIYALDWRATDLSQMGAELYGQARLPRRLGKLEYSGYYGFYFFASNDGWLQEFREEGLDFHKRPRGISPGFDLRWKTPIRGLKVGGSLMLYTAHGALVNGAYREPLTYWPTYYAQYDKRKLFLAAQYMRLVQPDVMNIAESSLPIVRIIEDGLRWWDIALRVSSRLVFTGRETRLLELLRPPKPQADWWLLAESSARHPQQTKPAHNVCPVSGR